ncbi:response regulator [Marinomonas pollencensis]|uniref:Response regulator receiver modulated diguanylate cyclase n=1 Tax=Marinomonas pollencensis TaxID=491954 RepID=A0A3E0DKV6_9GAMM|nr:response regulator [Marinomonas pollencensis]REG83273.1 response regulator receiver modulated diguanylate cyclase [Marinomonas pollencensis]
MNKVLVVEDSPVVLKVLKHLLSQSDFFVPVLCASYEEAKQVLNEQDKASFFAAIVDLNLPDAEDGEIVDFVLSFSIPCVVLTATYNDALRLELLNKGVLDYITKDSRYSFEHVVGVVERLKKNQSVTALVAEDSSTSRLFIKALLEQYQFNVITVENGQEALSMLESEPNIRLLITDHNMPLINGYDLVSMLRQSARFQDLVIIGLSAEGDNALSARFIKMGANDFIKKPFYHEEFHCRVIQNLESQEMLETIRNMDALDALTQLKNRRYLFDEGQAYFDKQASSSTGVGLAMMDLDAFRQVNDIYGFMVGDALLKEIGGLILSCFPEALSARFSGEEFCIVAPGGVQFDDQLKGFIASLKETVFTEAKIPMTCSIGVVQTHDAGLEEAIKVADARLYEAKSRGRDQIVTG